MMSDRREVVDKILDMFEVEFNYSVKAKDDEVEKILNEAGICLDSKELLNMLKVQIDEYLSDIIENELPDMIINPLSSKISLMENKLYNTIYDEELSLEDDTIFPSKNYVIDILPTEEFVQSVFTDLVNNKWIYVMRYECNMMSPTEVVFDDKFYKKYKDMYLLRNEFKISERLIKQSILNFIYTIKEEDLTNLNLEECRETISLNYNRYKNGFKQCLFK